MLSVFMYQNTAYFLFQLLPSEIFVKKQISKYSLYSFRLKSPLNLQVLLELPKQMEELKTKHLLMSPLVRYAKYPWKKSAVV